MNGQYDKSAWEHETDLGRRLYIYNYAMKGNELTGWELIKVVVAQLDANHTEKIFLWQRKKSKDEELIQVAVVESGYWRHAQHQLLNQLQHCMRPNIPRGSGQTAIVGDVQYVAEAQGTKEIAAIYFTRGNLQITVRSSGKKPVDVAALAKKIDGFFTKAPTKDLQRKKLVKAVQPNTIKAKKAKPMVLIDRLPEPVARSGWLRVTVPEGEIRRDGDVLLFEAGKDGAKSVEIMNFKIE
jgi:hypothetical protein